MLDMCKCVLVMFFSIPIYRSIFSGVMLYIACLLNRSNWIESNQWKQIDILFHFIFSVRVVDPLRMTIGVLLQIRYKCYCIEAEILFACYSGIGSAVLNAHSAQMATSRAQLSAPQMANVANIQGTAKNITNGSNKRKREIKRQRNQINWHEYRLRMCQYIRRHSDLSVKSDLLFAIMLERHTIVKHCTRESNSSPV